MRKKAFYTSSLVAVCLLFNLLPAQSPQDCYKTYKTRGDTYKKQGDLAAAKKQYQTARNCNYLTNAQRKEIDSLIAAIR